MSTHMPGFKSILQVFCIILGWLNWPPAALRLSLSHTVMVILTASYHKRICTGEIGGNVIEYPH